MRGALVRSCGWKSGRDGWSFGSSDRFCSRLIPQGMCCIVRFSAALVGEIVADIGFGLDDRGEWLEDGCGSLDEEAIRTLCILSIAPPTLPPLALSV